MFYLVRTPGWLKKFYNNCIWEIDSTQKVIYLTFDDGPTPQVTDFVLSALKKHDAQATFFCIGKNAEQHFDIYKKIIEQGHAVGNHTYSHLNGWNSTDESYLADILKAKKIIDSNLFRPPYGRISKFQLSHLKGEKFNLKTIMWGVLSGDFDKDISADDCYLNIIQNTKEGSIVVFHDSEKAFEKLQQVLPLVLNYFSEKGFAFKKIQM